MSTQKTISSSPHFLLTVASMFLFSTAAQAQSANQSSEAVAAGLEKEVSNRSRMATEAYLGALLELASTNLVGPAAEVEKQRAITISKRTQLAGVLGSTAVANIDRQYANLFTDEFRKHNSDLAKLSDACLANSEEAKALRILVDSTSNPILTFLAHAPPFRWEERFSGTNCAAECRYWTADSGKSDVPAYLLPRIKSRNKTGFNQTERVLVWQCSRNTANLLQDAYKKYVSSATEFKSHADSEVESNSPTIDEALVQQNRQSLVALCGEAAVADLDKCRSLYTFAGLTRAKDESSEHFVERLRATNPLFAEACDARYETAEIVQNAAYQLKLSKESNPIILEFARRQTREMPTPTTTATSGVWSFQTPPHLSKHVQDMYDRTFSETADKLLSAYNNYETSIQALSGALRDSNETQINVQKVLVYRARQALLAQIGPNAVAKLDRQLDIKNSILKYFAENKNDIYRLCNGCSKRLMHGRGEKNAEQSFDTANLRDELILNMFRLPSRDILFDFAPNISYYFALTEPNLEPTYPAIQKRPPVYKLPVIARDDGSRPIAYWSMNPSDSQARNRGMIELLQQHAIRTECQNITSAYENYQQMISQFSITHARSPHSVETIAHEMKVARDRLIDISGAEAVEEIERQNGYKELLKQANIE